jgi:hypothetical protein
MLYWLGVYLLVAIAVAVPLMVLYVVGLVFWLGAAAIRSTVRSVRDVLPVERHPPEGSISFRMSAANTSPVGRSHQSDERCEYKPGRAQPSIG